jgi:P4 family phage/plasmid primase-like protien
MLCFLPALYYRETLEEEMNMAIHLFAFANGKCVDLKLGQVRDIQPTDYISQTTGYDKPKAANSEVRARLHKFLFGLYENEEVLNYTLRVLASCLYGENRFHEFYVYTGTGGNGKGMIAALIKSAFGDYYHSVDITLFTKPRERADQPIPALVDARYKRLMMTTEPEKDDEFQKGLLKKVSGGDLIEARTLFSKDIIRYTPQFKTIFQTNAIPKIKLDDGIGRRMKVIDFPFKFRPEEECTTPLHRVADPNLLHDICMNDAARDEFILWLLEIYNDEVKGIKSLQPPNEVKDATGAYFDDNNPYKFWIEEQFELTKNAEDKISANELQRYYCNDRGVEKVNPQSLAQGLQFNGIERKRFKTGYYYVGIKRKATDIE